MQRWRHIATTFMLLASAGFGVGVQPVLAAGVVGTGTPGSCDETALDTALAGGGLVTFNCGAAPHTIPLTSEKVLVLDTQIDGGGLITLDGQNQTRLFYVNDSIRVDLIGITLTGGNGAGISAGAGGAIVNNGLLVLTSTAITENSANLGGAINNEGELTLDGSSVTNNAAAVDGGGIYNRDRVGGRGILTATDSDFSGNSAGEDGGAIFNSSGDVTLAGSTVDSNSTVSRHGGAIFSSSGTLAVTASALNDNYAGVFGGALYFDGGTAEFTHSTLSNNSSGAGGAIYHDAGALMISSSLFSNNSAGDGGAIRNTGVVEITDSTFSGNSAEHSSGAITNNGTLEISNSTLSDNTAAAGGALLNAGNLEITNSTLSGNSGEFGGGALYNYTGTMAVTSSTISNNSGELGGAILNDGATFLTSSIVAGNTATGPNCDIHGGSITSLGSNLSDDDSCLLTQAGDIQNSASVNLGPLQDNGGLTETMLPGANSDAVDTSDCTLTTAADQRGVARPVGASCDIGAVERVQGATYRLCANYYTGAVTSPLNGNCATGTVEVTPFDKSFCIDLYTGKLLYQFGRACNPPRVAHTMPADGDLLTCVSLYTGINRWVANHSQCSAYELANTLPASP